MSEELLIARDGPCWTFTLNRPDKMNALSAELVEALLDAVDEVSHGDARLVVFRGNGKNFSAGFDFDNLSGQSDAELLWRFVRVELLLQRVAALPCPTVGLAHGRNFGAGVDLFAVCRQRICAPASTFRMPGLQFGLVLGSRRFAALVGEDVATDILGAGRTFDAEEAARNGFVTETAGQDQWDDRIARAAATASTLPASDYAAMLRAVRSEANDVDLARLVRSAARSGLRQRIANFRRQA